MTTAPKEPSSKNLARLRVLVEEIARQHEADGDYDPAHVDRLQPKRQAGARVAAHDGRGGHDQSIVPNHLPIDREENRRDTINAESQPRFEGIHFMDVSQIEKGE